MLSAQAFRSVIDLGTASVKTLVIEAKKGQAHIWGYGQAPLEGAYGSDGQILDYEAVAAACDVALSAAEEMTCRTFGHKLVPDQSLWSVPGWLCQGQIFDLQQRRPQPAKRISRRECSVLQTRLDRVVTRLSGKPIDVITSHYVEGHAVTEAIGLRGGLLSLRTLVISIAPDALAALRAVAAALELDPPVFTSQARAVAAGSPSNAVVLDIGRWGTGIVTTRMGQPAGSAWTPLGGQSLYRTLVNDFGLTPAQLLDFCRAYAARQLPPEMLAAADAALVDPVTRWLDSVVEKLATLATEAPLPYRIRLAGGASQLPAVAQGAHGYPWMRQLPWPRHPEVRLWQAAGLSELKNHTDRVWNASDLVRLGLARLAARSAA
jgi:hypothetical protein